MKKKYFLVILFLVLVMFLSGCGGVVTPAVVELVKPLDDYTNNISQGFGDYLGYYGGKYYDGFHSGEDISVVAGTPVYAITSGRVAKISDLGALGHLIVLEHNKGPFKIPGRNEEIDGQSYHYPSEEVDMVYSVYTHVDPGDLLENDWVETGEKIADIADISAAGLGAHLHFGIRHPDQEPSSNWTMVGDLYNWSQFADGTYNGYYKNLQGMVDAGLRHPSDFLGPASPTNTYTITASAGSHGSISPPGDVTVNQGSDKLFTITPDAGYQIADVLVDGSSVGAVSSYTFTNITQDHTIYATLVVLVNAITDANFSVQYPEGYETDASNMLVWANQVVSTLQKSFPDFLDVIDSRILIVIKDTGDPSQTSADVINTSITFIAPSVAVEESDYYDEDYYIGNIAHELGHIYLDRIRNLTGGYLRSDVPAWFDEGFCEYLRLLVLGEQRFDEKYYWYLPEIPNIVAHGIAGISNIYAGGSWILRFIDSEFGIDTIKAIITSKQSTFLAALTEATNLTLAQFEEQLKEWLKERPT